MSDFQRISIHGFRRLAGVDDLAIRPLTVLIGANGVGKTSFLDALSLLAKSAAGQLNQCLSGFGGINSVLTRDMAEKARIEIDMSAPPHAPLKYALELRPEGQGYEIAVELLTQQLDPSAPEPFRHIQSYSTDIRYFDLNQKQLVRQTQHAPQEEHFDAGSHVGGSMLVQPTWDHNHSETSLSQVPKMFQQSESFRHRLAGLAYYAALNFNAAAGSPVRLPQQMRPAALPGPTGEDLVSCLYYLRETDRARFEVIENTLATAFPGFERLDFPPVAAGTLAVTWKESGFSKPFYMHELSEGTLRFLWLITLLQSPGLTDLTLIDEPEVSLHPDLLRLFVDLLREASDRTQLIVATQSERLVRFLKPAEVLVCDGEEGSTRLRWADTLDLDEWLEDYALDELWRLGRLGGRS